MNKKEHKIALAQLNSIVGNVEYNKNKALEYIKKANDLDIDLIIFPELFLLGHPMGDILGRYPYCAIQCQKALEEIKQYVTKTRVLIGYPEINKNNFEKPFYNSIAFIENQEIKKSIKKSLLPNYSEHNDYRYFEPYKIDKDERIIEINGLKYGVIVCEDGWNDFDFFDKKLYKNDPLKEIAPLVDVVVCPASSCTRTKKEQLKHNMISYCAKKYNVKYIYVNQVGANDELVYEGSSRMYDENGVLVANAKSFEEEFFIVSYENGGKINPLPKGLEKTLNSQKEFSLDHYPDLERTYKAIVLAIKDYFSKNGFKKAVLGLSGGLDSTICAVLLADALGKENVLGVSMPSKLTSQESKDDAEQLAQNLGIFFKKITIKDMQDLICEKFKNMFEDLPKDWCQRYTNSYTQDNIQARSRAMILWGIANEYGALPIATSDKSELYMGYATINGDMSGGYAPICDVVKTKLFSLARWMNENRPQKNAIPESIILKPPGAELAIDPKTGKTLLAEDALMPYEFLDEVIWRMENLNQSINNMMNYEFLYEKKNKIDNETKKAWLSKFAKRMNSALYKWYIIPPGPVIDARSINKIEFRQAITSSINYFN